MPPVPPVTSAMWPCSSPSRRGGVSLEQSHEPRKVWRGSPRYCVAAAADGGGSGTLEAMAGSVRAIAVAAARRIAACSTTYGFSPCVSPTLPRCRLTRTRRTTLYKLFPRPRPVCSSAHRRRVCFGGKDTAPNPVSVSLGHDHAAVNSCTSHQTSLTRHLPKHSQLAERRTFNPVAEGSSPSSGVACVAFGRPASLPRVTLE